VSSLEGRTALVTAASSGLGHATARRLVAEGAQVFGSGYEEDLVPRAAQEIGAAGHAVSDFSDPASTEALADAALETLGHVDILVSNTGGPPPSAFLDLGDEDWDRAYRLVLDSAVRLTRRVLPGMVERHWGRLVYFTSSGVVQPLPGMHLSNVMRSAVQGLARSLVTEVGPHGVTTHVLAPGHIDTERRRRMTEHRAKQRGVPTEQVDQAELATVAVGRFGTAEDMAELVAFLSTDKAGYLTGQTHRVDGGFTYAIPI
jgi:3-oxoacyl-[acyl-carrier protein] reductase